MPRKRNTLRLAGEGSKHYLEFLRNLTPQVLLFAFVLIVGRNLNFSEIDLSNWQATMIFYVLLLAFIFSVFGNFNQLFIGCYSDISRWGKKISVKASGTNRHGLSRFWFFLVAAFKMRGIVFLEILFVVIFLQIVLAVIVMASVSSAGTFLKMGA